MVETHKQVAAYVETIRQIDVTLDPASGSWAKRKRHYDAVGRELLADQDPIRQQMGRSWRVSSRGHSRVVVEPICRDNLDLER